MLHGVMKKVRVAIIVCVNVTWCYKKVRVELIVCVNVTWYHVKGVSWINCLCKCYMILWKRCELG
jgi:hypothetical protein